MEISVIISHFSRQLKKKAGLAVSGLLHQIGRGETAVTGKKDTVPSPEDLSFYGNWGQLLPQP